MVGTLDKNLQEKAYQSNLLQDMVEKRTRAKMEAFEREQEQIRREAEEKRKADEAEREMKTRDQLAKAIKDGIPIQAPESLATGRPNHLMEFGLGPNGAPEQSVESHRPATEQDLIGIASQSMTPYQTANLAYRVGADEKRHGYRMQEIDARGGFSKAVADIRSRASERNARIRSAAGGRGGSASSKDFSYTLENAQQELAEVEADIAAAAASRPPPPADQTDFLAMEAWKPLISDWNRTMSSLTSQRKFYQSQIYKATQHGAGPALQPPAPGGGRPPPPQPPRAEDLNKARTYLQKAGGDKARARQLAAQDGWQFPTF